jgi:hypothetical protein
MPAGHGNGRRVAAVALLGVLIAIVWLGPVDAYLDLIDAAAQQLARRQALLQRYQSLTPAPAETAAVAGAATGPRLLFPEIAEAQALALLQESVKRAAAANHVEIHSLQALRSELLGDAAKVGVRIRAAGDVASLGRLLYAVESADPVLYPDNLHIQVPPATGAASGNLEIQLDLLGFRRKPS